MIEDKRMKRESRAGQALVEFAIISFVLSAIVAGLLGIMVLALGSFQNNIAAENAGRVLDQHPALVKENFVTHFSDDSSDDYFDVAIHSWDDVSARQVYRFLNEYSIDGTVNGPVLYDESRLILSREDWENRDDLDLPAINQSLLGQYVFDPDVEIDGQEELGAYRFPGAIVTNPDGERTVMVPLLPGPNGVSGIERTFHVDSTSSELFYPVAQDWVGPVVVGKELDGDDSLYRVIMFHPSQPASMISIEVERNEQGKFISQTPVEADDDVVDSQIGDPPGDYQLTPAASTNEQYGASSSRGEFGLGESLAFVTTVRPFRAVFETSSIFRLDGNGAERSANQSKDAFKREVDDSVATFPVLLDASDDIHTTDTPVSPFVDHDGDGVYHNNKDQSLDLEVPVLFNEILPRYFVDFPISTPASNDNDFVSNVFRLLPDDDGIWRVSVAAEFQLFDDPADSSDDTDEWVRGHVLELRLYRNGVYERLIERLEVDPDLFDASDSNPTVVLQNQIAEAFDEDVLQVRVFSERPTADPDNPSAPERTYDIQLTGNPETNWVSFERVGD